VTYVLNTVKEDFGDRPVAINVSIGSDVGPHDGFTELEDWLTETFKNTPGKVLVMAAGNAAGKHQHAEIQMPAAGNTVIPIRLYDQRTKVMTRDRCRLEDPTESLELNLFYPFFDGGVPSVTCSLDAPDDGKDFIAGPTLSAAEVPPQPITFRGWTLNLTHHGDNQNLRAGGTVHRNLFRVEFQTNSQKKHWTGDYQLKIETTGAVTAHLWVQQSRGYGLAINPLTTPDEVVAGSSQQALIGPDAGSANVITAAAYTAETAGHEVARFSSRGPLVRYDTTAGLPITPPKPDLAAPGVDVDAAQSRDIEAAKKKYKRAEQMSGTSMATPHVTGAAALLLEKKKTLTAQDIAQILKTNVRADRPKDTPDETGAGQLDVKNAIDHIP
jgi:subtilisin family serine protease